MRGTSLLLNCAIVFVITWRFAVAVSFRCCRRRSISKKVTNIRKYLQISVGIFRYLRVSSNICSCQPSVNKILNSHMEYTENLPETMSTLHLLDVRTVLVSPKCARVARGFGTGSISHCSRWIVFVDGETVMSITTWACQLELARHHGASPLSLLSDSETPHSIKTVSQSFMWGRSAHGLNPPSASFLFAFP